MHSLYTDMQWSQRCLSRSGTILACSTYRAAAYDVRSFERVVQWRRQGEGQGSRANKRAPPETPSAGDGVEH